MCKALAFAFLLVCGGCSAFTSGLADVRTGLDGYEAGLAELCGGGVVTDLCERARGFDESAQKFYGVAVVADQTGRDLQPTLDQVIADIKAGWDLLKGVFAKKQAAPTSPSSASFPTPAATEPLSWEQFLGTHGA